MITADQLVAHAIGDYLLKSHWMAIEKTKRSIAALAHVVRYAIPFLWFRPSLAALAFIVGTHLVIVDGGSRVTSFGSRTGLGRTGTWRSCSATGYPPDAPAWLAVCLLIIADNILHVICNGIALKYL